MSILEQDPWYQTFRELIAVEVSTLREQTRHQVNQFWQQHHETRATRPYNEWGCLGLRLRERSVVFGIEWYVNSHYGPGASVSFSARQLPSPWIAVRSWQRSPTS